ncbi:uncharacterized protein TNCV_1711201 [Trichonephila clavipes]|nr:uncharacterized protein TNCV_1711201 [Trichonephila clavipes]
MCHAITAPIALKKFRTLKGIKKGTGLMAAQGLEKMIQKFEREETGSFHVQSGRGRKKVNLTVVEVATILQEESSGGFQTCNARGITRTLDRPVNHILRNILHCYSYKISHMQQLLPTDLPVRDYNFMLSWMWTMNSRGKFCG